MADIKAEELVEWNEPIPLKKVENYIESIKENGADVSLKDPQYTENFDSIVTSGDGKYLKMATMVIGYSGSGRNPRRRRDEGKIIVQFDSRNPENNTQLYVYTETSRYEEGVESLAESWKPEVSEEITRDDIGGYEDKIDKFWNEVVAPLQNPNLFRKASYDPEGVILHGPPGTGKTMIARAASNEAGAEYIEVKPSDVYGNLMGDSEQNLQEIFEHARESTPSILMMDEIDSLTSQRSSQDQGVENRVKNMMLSEIQNLNENLGVQIVGTTNRIDSLDSAFLRPERLGTHIEIGEPDLNDRKQIWQIHTREPEEEEGVPVEEGIDYVRLAEESEDMVGAEIGGILQEAVREEMMEISSSVDNFDEVRFEDYEDELRITEEEIIERLEEDDTQSGMDDRTFM